MNEKEQNLKLLRKLIYILKTDVKSNRESFVEDTTEIDFGEFYNEKVGEITMALLEFKNVLEKLIDDLSSEIQRLQFENQKTIGVKENAL